MDSSVILNMFNPYDITLIKLLKCRDSINEQIFRWHFNYDNKEPIELEKQLDILKKQISDYILNKYNKYELIILL